MYPLGLFYLDKIKISIQKLSFDFDHKFMPYIWSFSELILLITSVADILISRFVSLIIPIRISVWVQISIHIINSSLTVIVRVVVLQEHILVIHLL